MKLAKLASVLVVVPSLTVAASLAASTLATPAAAHGTRGTIAAPLTPLDAPSGLALSDLTPTSATLSWAPVAGPVRRIVVYIQDTLGWVRYSPLLGPTATTYPLGPFAPGTTHTFAVQAFANPNTGYSDSPISEPITFSGPGGNLVVVHRVAASPA